MTFDTQYPARARAAPSIFSVHASTRHSLSDLIGARPHLLLMMCRHAPVQKINARAGRRHAAHRAVELPSSVSELKASAVKARGALATLGLGLGRHGAGRQTRLTDFNYIRRYLARAHALYTLELDGTILLITLPS